MNVIISYLKCIATNAVFQAVVGGVLVFIIGELIQRLYVSPLTKYNDLRSQVCYCLVQYANAYLNPCGKDEKLSDWHKEAGDELRKVSSKLEAFAQENKYFAKRTIPPKKNLQEAAKWIRRLSNSMRSSDGYRTIRDNRKDQNAICLYLNLDVEDYSGLDTWVSDKHFIKIAKKKIKQK